MTLTSLIDLIKSFSLSYAITKPAASHVALPPFNTGAPEHPDVLLLLNFSTPQRAALLGAPGTRALLYTPANEHFGIGPVEAMVSGLPVLACDSGGPTESVMDPSFVPWEGAGEGVARGERTGWLRPPEPEKWAEALEEIVGLSEEERRKLGERAKKRARELFGMEAMATGLEEALQAVVEMGPVRGWEMGLLWFAVGMLIMLLGKKLWGAVI